MIALVFAMIVCLVLGLAVVAVVAIPARREGRDVLTARGEDVVTRVRERTESVTSAAREKTGDLVGSTRPKAPDAEAPQATGPEAESRQQD
ncbi:hypothetical protein [Lapillicoccus sp.]|uniref:hypothetical protein n=1 Tax=Lapillicoccus sp. TaxID=1909287 RepID=UPI0039832B5D